MRFIAILYAAILISGCAIKVQIPPELAFSPAQKIDVATIKWIVAQDSTAECKRLFPAAMAMHPVIPACASWDFEARQCVIVTSSTTSHQILGHEIRHCFEGNFH